MKKCLGPRFVLLPSLLVGLAFLPGTFLAAPIGTAFTYQGRLANGTNAANGTFDLKFTVHDAVTAGSQIAGPVTNTAVALTNGLLSTSVDFGTGVFAGSARWLEISARTNGAGAFTVLSPRQELKPTPYALYAPNAGSAAVATTASTVGAGAVGASGLQTGAVDTSKIADGTIVGTDLSSTLLNSTFWRLTGNAGTTAGVNFLGTTDNQALELKVNGLRAFRVEPTAGAPNVVGGGGRIASWVAGYPVGGAIGGGKSNRLEFLGPTYSSPDYCTIAGGLSNVITGAEGNFIGGGRENTIDAGMAAFSTVGGGRSNYISLGVGTTIGGGVRNQNNADNATISGGWGNVVAGSDMTGSANDAVIGGGNRNSVQVSSTAATIGGGYSNTVGTLSPHATIAGGANNAIKSSNRGATIGGGLNNVVSNVLATVAGGSNNVASGIAAVISGGFANRVGTNVQGATVSGGAGNSVVRTYSPINVNYPTDYGSVGGGRSNTIDAAAFGTIGGGTANRVYGGDIGWGYGYGTIGGGYSNLVSASYSTIGGGVNNQIQDGFDPTTGTIAGGSDNRILSGAGVTIGGGSANTNLADSSTIAGGGGNYIWGMSGASGSHSLGGGLNNTINTSGRGATIAGGIQNRVAGNVSPGYSSGAAIGGGWNNTVNRAYGTIPGGLQAATRSYGQIAYASGQFATNGDAQASEYVCRNVTTNATQTELFLDGSSQRMSVPANTTWAFEILVAGRSAAGGSAIYRIIGGIENNGGTTAIIGAISATVVAEDVASWDATVVADNTNDALSIRVTGQAATAIRWVATVRTAEVNH